MIINISTIAILTIFTNQLNNIIRCRCRKPL